MSLNSIEIFKMLDRSRDLCFLLDKNFIVQACNEAAKNFFEIDMAQSRSLHQHLDDFCQTTNVTEASLTSLTTGSVDSIDDIAVLNNYDQWAIEWGAQPISDDGGTRWILLGKHNKLVSVNTEQQLDASLPYIYSILENLPEYVYWKDTTYHYRGCNHKVAKYLDLDSPQDLLGKSDYDFNWDSKRVNELRRIDKLVLQGVRNVTEDVIPSPDGTSRVMLTSKSPLYDDDGNIIGILGLSTDITELKTTQSELEYAMNLAKQASSAKSEFIANMSHDIRSPMTGILALASSIYNQVSSPTIRHEAKLLLESTNELLQLLNEILEVSQLDSKTLKSNKEVFDLENLLRKNIKLLLPNLESKAVKIKTTIAKDCPIYCYGDRRHLNRIILNLLSNAVKFTERGSISITLAALSTNKGHAEYELRIKDTGIGIAEDKKEEIYSQFTRLLPSYIGKHKGSGLGLYAVKRYLELLGGTISLKSRLGVGSEFTIRFPLKLSNKEKLPRNLHSANEWLVTDSIEPISPSDEFGATCASVLIVEDSDIAALAAEKILTSLNCHVRRVYSGKDALRAIRKEKYDLILMDIGLPDMSGHEVTMEIRRMGTANAKIPIVALTGHMNADEHDTCAQSGMNEMLIKPMNKKTALSCLMRYVYAAEAEETTPIKPAQDTIAPSPATLAVIDMHEGKQLAGGSEEIALEFLNAFASTITNECEQMQDLMKKGELDKLYELVHRVYGTVLYIGVPQLRNSIEHFKERVKNKVSGPELEKAYADMHQKCTVLLQQLEALQESRSL